MKGIYFILTLVALLQLFFAYNVEGLKCFICQSVDDNEGCNATYVAPKYLKECKEDSDESSKGTKSSKWHACRTTASFVDFEVNSKKPTGRIMRNCGFIESKYDDICYYRAGYGSRTEVCSCLTDGCNSLAVANLPSKLILFLTFSSALIMVINKSIY